MDRNALAARLATIFLAELEDQVQTLNLELIAFEKTPADTERIHTLFRVAHTIKGAAAAAGQPDIRGCCHALESLLDLFRDGVASPTPEDFKLLFRAADLLASCRATLASGEPTDSEALQAMGRDLTARSDGLAGGALARPETPRRDSPASLAASPAASPARPPDAHAGAHAPASDPKPTRSVGGETLLRIEAAKIDGVLAASTHLVETFVGLGVIENEVRIVDQGLEELARAWKQARSHLAPSSLERGSPAEVAHNSIDELVRRLTLLTGQRRARLRRHLRAARQASAVVSERATSLRLRPVDEVVVGLRRVARDVAEQCDKAVKVEIVGGEAEADAAVLGALREPLVHLMRNAIDHGIESREARAAAGKDDEATVIVRAQNEGGRLLVSVEDNGGGIDLIGVRRRLDALGWVTPEDDREVADCIFRPGFSTRDDATDISGRGVGLDLVRRAVSGLGGTVRIDWKPGLGTRFTIDCPMSASALAAILARVGTQLYAIPLADVARVVRSGDEHRYRLAGGEVFQDRDLPMPVAYLGAILGAPLPLEAPEDSTTALVIEGAAGAMFALEVDEVLRVQDLVVRPLAEGRLQSELIRGAAVTDHDQIALVLNGPALGQEVRRRRFGRPAGAVSAATEAPKAQPTLLVADDSITSRTLVASALEAAGYKVIVAPDGLEAFRLLQEHAVDLVVSDVEMPHMDGFQLCEALRRSERIRTMPVIVVTSRESPEDRARGMEVGADAYLGKSSFDQERLLALVTRFL